MIKKYVFWHGIIGALIDRFLWSFIPPGSKGLSGPYMWSALDEPSVLSRQLRIIPSCISDLLFDVPGQYKCWCNYRTFPADSTPESVKNSKICFAVDRKE